MLENAKGWAFVVVTALLLGLALNRYFRHLRQAADQLQDEEARLRLMGDNLPDSYVFQCTTGPDGKPRFNYVSAGVERVHGIRPEDVLEDAGILFRRAEPAQISAYAAAVAESARKLSDFDMELRATRPDGGVRLVRVRSRPRRDEAGQILWDGFVMDITERKRVETELRESARLLQTVINLVPHPIFAKDRQSRHLFVNEACAAMNGLTPEQMIGSNDLEFVPNRAQAEAFMRDDREVIDKGRRKFIAEESFANAAGQVRILQTIKIPFELPGTGPAVLGVAVDITEQKKVEAALKLSEAKWRSYVENAPVGVLVADANGRHEEANRAAEELFGYEPGGLLQTEIRDLIPAGDGEIQRHLERLAAVGEAGGEFRLRRKDGTLVWAMVRASKLADGRHLGIFQNITEQKKVADALQRSEQNYREIFNATHEGIFLHDSTTGALLDVNDAALRMHGYETKEEFLARDFSQVMVEGSPYDWQGARRRIQRAVEDGPQVFEWLNRRRNGEQFWVEVSLRSSQIGGRKKILAVVRDISQRKAQEQEIQRLNRTLDQRVQERTAELRASNEELDAFAYAVSHDLRAPLRAMSGFSQALTEDFGPQLPAAAHEYLGHIRTGSREMGALIDGLLRLSRSTRGTLQRTSVNLSALATRLLGELQQGEPHRRVACTVDAGLTANGDAHLLEIALRNLLGNAWKYTAHSPQALIHVHGRIDPKSTTFCVSDNGAGFDMKHAAKLFQPFQRLHRDDEFPGIGIGLATVQRIIRRHGGTLEATGAPGAGAHFSFTLPGS